MAVGLSAVRKFLLFYFGELAFLSCFMQFLSKLAVTPSGPDAAVPLYSELGYYEVTIIIPGPKSDSCLAFLYTYV